MYNKIILVGNLTRSPETRQLDNGQSVTNLGLATNNSYKTASGEQRDETCFVDVTIWGKQGENCERYLSVGRQVLIEGRLRQESWEDKETGQKRSRHTIIANTVRFLSSSGGGNQQNQTQANDNSRLSSSGSDFKAPSTKSNQENDFKAPSTKSNYDNLDDDVPF